jgi:hypothetical protein
VTASPATLLAALGKLPGGFYLEHVEKQGDGKACRCELLSPDEGCPVGEALWRLRAREMFRFDDGRRGP